MRAIIVEIENEETQALFLNLLKLADIDQFMEIVETDFFEGLTAEEYKKSFLQQSKRVLAKSMQKYAED